MDLSLGVFLGQIAAYPSLGIILLLVVGVTIVSGATDAPNAIATAVSTRCLRPSTALILAAVFNFVGLVGMTYISTAVAHTMFSMVDFSGDTHTALLALEAAMIGSIGWGFFCWFRGIPASKSHSLIAGITGAAIAMNGLAGVVPREWAKVIYGMLFSLIAGFALGWLCTKIIELVARPLKRRTANRIAMIFQDICACALSFLHGAQDGQKFMSTATIAVGLALGTKATAGGGYPLWLMFACAIIMSVGTAVGGKKIIKTVGTQMVRLEKYQGAAASISAGISLLLATFGGMPVSTTHTKTAAIMGAGAAKSAKHVDWGIAYDMVLTWVLTFPGCGLIGYVLAWVFLQLF